MGGFEFLNILDLRVPPYDKPKHFIILKSFPDNTRILFSIILTFITKSILQ